MKWIDAGSVSSTAVASAEPAHPEASKLLARAYDLLARRAYASRELQQKLRKECDDADVVGEVLRFLQAKKYVDDDRYATEAARSLSARRGWGKDKIRAWMMARGVSSEAIQGALGQLDSTAELERAARLAESLRHRGRSAEQIFRFLRARGFSAETSRRAALADD
jgi:regulatory protein